MHACVHVNVHTCVCVTIYIRFIALFGKHIQSQIELNQQENQFAHNLRRCWESVIFLGNPLRNSRNPMLVSMC